MSSIERAERDRNGELGDVFWLRVGWLLLKLTGAFVGVISFVMRSGGECGLAG